MGIDLNKVIDLAEQAGSEIMEIYQRDFTIRLKSDESPLTEADLASHRVIVNGLAEITPDIPVLSEESSGITWHDRRGWSRYWLIDPLDGTKEFIKKNDEFTVNIALIDQGEPVFGVVYAPALSTCYFGGTLMSGAWKTGSDGRREAIGVSPLPSTRSGWKIVGSRSHQSEAFSRFIANFEEVDVVSMGSSLKLCLVAEGKAHLYPRLGLTSEWDTAAADALLRGAGGQCLQTDSLKPVTYNQKEDILNPWFICCSEISDIWTSALDVADHE